jgi:hypothetical protein
MSARLAVDHEFVSFEGSDGVADANELPLPAGGHFRKGKARRYALALTCPTLVHGALRWAGDTRRRALG